MTRAQDQWLSLSLRKIGFSFTTLNESLIGSASARRVSRVEAAGRSQRLEQHRSEKAARRLQL